MARRSKIAFLVPFVLLFVRSLVSVVHGQILQSEWSHKSDPIKLYRPPMGLPVLDRISLSNLTNKYWSVSSLEPPSANSNNELVEIPSPLLRNLGFHSQQLSPTVYLLLKEQKLSPPRTLPVSVAEGDVMEALNNKLVYQQPKKRQDQQKETDALLAGSGPSVDYSSDDELSAQVVQPANSSPYDFSQLPPSKAKIQTVKSKQAAIPASLARYLIFSNLKRARDGYICHFKLCQVGVSGKRLINVK